MADLGQFETLMCGYASRADVQKKMRGYTDSWTTGGAKRTASCDQARAGDPTVVDWLNRMDAVPDMPTRVR